MMIGTPQQNSPGRGGALVNGGGARWAAHHSSYAARPSRIPAQPVLPDPARRDRTDD